MEIRALEAFVAVFSAGSITGAARLLDRSQPAVTRQIQELESEVGFDLFHRNGPRISPTERGVRFYTEVERLLSSFGHLSERVSAIARDEPQAIEISGTPALAAGILPAALRLLDQHLPRRTHIRTASAEDVVQSVLARSSDIGVTTLPIEQPGIEVHTIFEAPCVAAVPEGHPLARKGKISIRDFAGLPMAVMANPYRLQRRIDVALRKHGAEPGRVIDTNSSLNALQMVRAGLAVSVVEPATALGVPIKGVAVRPLDVNIPHLWAIVTALARPLSPVAKELISAIGQAASEVLPNVRRHDPSSREAIADLVYGDRLPVAKETAFSIKTNE
jgi:DNA-binding transcriptional LysR family regulator